MSDTIGFMAYNNGCIKLIKVRYICLCCSQWKNCDSCIHYIYHNKIIICAWPYCTCKGLYLLNTTEIWFHVDIFSMVPWLQTTFRYVTWIWKVCFKYVLHLWQNLIHTYSKSFPVELSSSWYEYLLTFNFHQLLISIKINIHMKMIFN